MNTIALAIAIAVIIESVLEYVKSGYEAAKSKQYGRIIYYAVALALSLLLCFYSNVDIFSALDIALKPEWVGIFLTALFASRGASYLTSIISKIEE
ncbi:MAG: hypothetical protein LKJ90_05060 [Faecalibacterium sp.]|nr:hypothetical protein [Faecalibacterium sp.]